jgi:hypothetical protein
MHNKNKKIRLMANLILIILIITGLIYLGYSIYQYYSTRYTYNSPAATVNLTDQTDMATVLKNVKWGDNMTVSFSDGQIRLQADGIPNHKRDSQYAVPNTQVVVPDASTAHIIADPTKAQTYDFKITTTPKVAATKTSAPLGSIGLMISGSVLFNPYEGDGKTVAMSSNFYMLDSKGNKVWFVDECSAHPTPDKGEYHYHAVSSCVTSEVDTDTGPSHITGIAMDGFPIYGFRDINGNKVLASQLDECNGITSPTPEFPNGIYHYVLPDTTDATSSIRCFSGTVDTSQLRKMPMMR